MDERGDAKLRLLRWWKRILSDAPPPEEDEDRRSLEEWNDLVEQRIREAMERGEFDNPALKGRSVLREENPFLAPEEALAYSLLAGQGFVPQWMEERKALEQAIDDLRRRMRRAWHWYMRRIEVLNARGDEDYATWKERREVEARWQGYIQTFRGEIRALNERIDTYNLTVPLVRFQMFRLRVDEELRHMGVPEEDI